MLDTKPELSVDPIHITALLNRDDKTLLLKWDPRYIAYAYLMIGNHLKARYIKLFLQVLVSKKIVLYEPFNRSIEGFKKEIDILVVEGSRELEEAMYRCAILSLDFLQCLLDFYQRRLALAHPPNPSRGEQRVKFARYYTSMLYTCANGQFDVRKESIPFDKLSFDPESRVTFTPPMHRVPDYAQPIENVELCLSVLALTELFSDDFEAAQSGGKGKVNLWPIRNLIAHRIPNQKEMLCYAKEIFKSSIYEEFLAIVVRNVR